MNEYTPFGEEWESNVCKMPKRQIVKMLSAQIEKADTLCSVLERLLILKMNGAFTVNVYFGQGGSEIKTKKAWEIALEVVKAYRGNYKAVDQSENIDDLK